MKTIWLHIRRLWFVLGPTIIIVGLIALWVYSVAIWGLIGLVIPFIGFFILMSCVFFVAILRERWKRFNEIQRMEKRTAAIELLKSQSGAL